MKRTVVVTGAILAALLLVLQASAAGGSTEHAKKHSGPITIESWLHANPSKTGLSGTVKACFKLKGAFVDQGGGPTWTDSTYAAATAPANKCGDWQPVGGFVFVPPDTTSAKSPNHVIEATNSAVRLFTPAGTILATADLNTFFVASTTQGLLFDPKVYFDRNAVNSRVYVVALQVAGKGDTSLTNNVSRLRIAVSRSSDPTNLSTTSWCFLHSGGSLWSR